MAQYTEPYHGARPRTTEVDRPVDDVLGAALGGTEQKFNFRDKPVPNLPPKQQIRQEEEVQTPPRREPRRNEGHQTRGARAMTDETVLAPGGLADQQTDTVCWTDLQDDALSVALLIPMPRRASRKELTGYRREFDNTVRKPGEDPSNFGITLEMLAVKAFGDMGQTAHLRLIRDRFIAGNESYELRRHLDCLPPDTPLRDIVDRCRVWKSHADPSVRRVSKPMPEPACPAYMIKKPEYEDEPVRTVTVNRPESSVDQSKELLKKLLAILTPAVPAPARAPEPLSMDKLVQLLIGKFAKNTSVPPAPAEPTKLETMLRTYFGEKQSPSQQSRLRPVRRNWSDVKCFFVWKNGSQCDPLPNVRRDFPIYIARLEGREDIDWLLDDIAKDDIAGGRKTKTDSRGGVRLSDQ